MANKNFYTGRDREIVELAERFEQCKKEGKTLYLDADDLADLADWYGMHKHFDLALEVADYGLKLHPNDTTLLVQKAFAYFDAGKTEQAEEVAALITEQRQPEALVLKASLLMERRHLEEAEALIESIEEKDDMATIMGVAYMYMDQQLPEKAEPWLQRGRELYPNEEPIIAASADYYYHTERYEEAMKAYNRLIDANPYSAPCWFGLARCQFEQQQLEDCIDSCDYAIVADEEFGEAYALKGNCLHLLENLDGAVECFIQADKYHAIDHDYLLSFRGLYETSRGNWQVALQFLLDAIELKIQLEHKQGLPMVFVNAAVCAFNIGRRGYAYEMLAFAEEHDPAEVEVHLTRGRFQAIEEQYEKALDSWHKAVDIDDSLDTWNEIVRVSFETGMLDVARRSLEYIKQEDADYPQVNERLAAIYLFTGRKELFEQYNARLARPIAQPLDALNYLMEQDYSVADLPDYMADFLQTINLGNDH